MNTAEMLESEDNETVLKDLGMAKMLRCRVRYFTDGAVIGSKEFVNEAFASARERFGPKRKDGARAMRGSGSVAKGLLVEYEGSAGKGLICGNHGRLFGRCAKTGSAGDAISCTPPATACTRTLPAQ